MKNFLRKSVSVILALVLALSVFAVAPYAASADIAVKTERQSYLQGENVTATVYFPGILSSLASLDLKLTYDTSKLEIVSVKNGAELDNALRTQINGKAFSESHKTAGTVLWSVAGTNNFEFKGTFATIVFTVKSKAAGGQCDLKLTVTNAANSGYVSMTKSVSSQNASFEIVKVAANDLAFELTADKKAYEIVSYKCATVDNITIPATYAGLPVVGIDDSVFSSHAELKTIVLPDSIRYIGARAFSGCSGVETIVIPDSCETIGQGAFSGCSKLKSATLPVGLETVEKNAFNGCYSLEKVEIPFTVTKIEAGAFENCYSLSEVKISKRTTGIAADAFKNCFDNIVFKTVEDNTYLPNYIKTNFPTAKIELIKDFSLGTATVSESAAYTGKPVTPAVTVKLTSGARIAKGTHYKVVYRNNVERGTAKIFVAGLGDYGEGYILTFKITCAHSTTKKSVGKEATCTTDGYYNITCTECGQVVRTEKIAAAGHKEGSWVIDKRPTLSTTGLKHSICSECGDTLKSNVVIPKAFPDLNGDGQINSSDALIVLQYATEMENHLTTLELMLNADTNGDSYINSSDALTILQIAIGMTVIDGYTA